MKTTGNTILITGGGSGIGRELALRFNELGNAVIVAGRRKHALEETIAERERMHAMPTYNATKAALHSYTVSLRTQLEGKIEVIELAPPAVRTELTPGQSTREGYMPLDEFADEAMTLFQRKPTPKEILVERVGVLRWAERDGRFDQVVAMLNAH